MSHSKFGHEFLPLEDAKGGFRRNGLANFLATICLGVDSIHNQITHRLRRYLATDYQPNVRILIIEHDDIQQYTVERTSKQIGLGTLRLKDA